MKKNHARWMLVVMILLLIVSMITPYIASAEENKKPSLYSDSAYLYNLGTGEVLFDKNSDRKLPIYNLTMLMTTYILIKDIESGKVSLNDKAEISKKAWSSEGTGMFLEVGRTVTVKKLLQGLTVAAGNDAAITTAEFLSRDTNKFVKRMNKEAKKLGMNDTEFHTPNGSRKDLSTAKDLIILSKSVLEEYPEYQKYFTQKEMKYDTRPGKTVKIKNQNSFVTMNPNAKGLKTGWGDKQFHLVAAVNKNGRNFLAVTLNSSSSEKRTGDITKLLTYGYEQYQVLNVARTGEKYTDFSVYKSNTPGPSTVVYKEDLKVVERVGVTLEDLTLDYEGHSYIVGGTKAGDELGKVKVYYEDKLLAEGAIVATESFERAKGFSVFLDSIALVFRQLFDSITQYFH